jgi:hypothetical protein
VIAELRLAVGRLLIGSLTITGMRLKLMWFHMMSYMELPADFRQRAAIPAYVPALRAAE